MQLKPLIPFVVFGFWMSALPADAASLYISPNNLEVKRGDTIALAVRLDTDEEECVNLVDTTINYSENIEPVDTTRGNSILSVWVQDPVIDKKARTITFAGGIPNGYCGRIAGDPRLTNVLVELLFRSPGMVIGTVSDLDVAKVNFDSQTRAFLNDGIGTEAELKTFGASINLLKQVGNTINNEWSNRIEADEIPPEEFFIQLERNENAFSNQFYIVFNTTDKQSGIDHYEVIEEPLSESKFFRWGATNAPWVEGRSPYLLEDQSLNSTIRVRAIDKAGNEYVSSLVPEEAQRTISFQNKIILAIIITVLVMFFTAATFAFFRYRQKRQTAKGEVLDETAELEDLDGDHDD